MFCKKCRLRDTCEAICPKLEKHLEIKEKYQREQPFTPKSVAILLDITPLQWKELSSDMPWFWDLLMPILHLLPMPLLKPFMLHYYDELQINEISSRLGIHRSTVRRRLDRAARILHAELSDEERKELRRRFSC